MVKGKGYRAALALLAVMLAAVSAYGQNRDAEYYSSQYVKWHKAHLADTNDIWPMVNLANYYADTLNPMKNLPKALDYISRSESRYESLLRSNLYFGELRRLQRKKITLQVLRNRKQEINDAALKALTAGTLTVSELEQYTDAYGVCKATVTLARIQRIGKVYATVRQRNTLDAYQHFIDQYPGTEEAQQAEARMGQLADSLLDAVSAEEAEEITQRYKGNRIVEQAVNRKQSHAAFANAKALNTVEGYRQFLAQYPSTSHSMEAVERIDALQGRQLAALHSPQELAAFALENSESHWVEAALDELYRMVTQENDVVAARLMLQHFHDDPRYNEVYHRYYLFHSQEGCYTPIADFKEQHPQFPFPNLVTRDLNETADIDGIELNKPFNEATLQEFAQSMKMFSGKGITYVMLQRALQNLIAAKDWKHAKSRYNQLSDCFAASDKDYQALGRMLDSAYNEERQPTQVTAGKGTVAGIAALPDDKTLYVTYRQRNGTTTLAKVTRSGERWNAAGNVTIEGLKDRQAVIYSVYDGGRRMLIGQNGDVWTAVADGAKWRVEERLPNPVNSEATETDAFMLPDGSGLLLASDRPGGYNIQPSGAYFHGDTALASDIYYIPRTAAGWGTPQNLGNKINSRFSERYPVMSKDMKTLYFVSDKGGGLGYGDVYAATRTDNGSWSLWSESEHLGKEANSAYAEGPLSLSRNEAHLYMGSTQEGRHGCYRIATGHFSGEEYTTVALARKQGDEQMTDCRVYDREGREVLLGRDSTGWQAYLAKRQEYRLSPTMELGWAPTATLTVANAQDLQLKGLSPEELSNKEYTLNIAIKEIEQQQLSPLGEREMAVLARFLNEVPAVGVSVAVTVAGTDAKACYQKSIECGQALKGRLVGLGVAEERVNVIGRGNRGSGDKGCVKVKFGKK